MKKLSARRRAQSDKAKRQSPRRRAVGTGRRSVHAMDSVRVETKLGWLVQIGTNPWGNALVTCPRCGQAATAGKTGDVWCRACGFDTATLAGCG